MYIPDQPMDSLIIDQVVEACTPHEVTRRVRLAVPRDRQGLLGDEGLQGGKGIWREVAELCTQQSRPFLAIEC